MINYFAVFINTNGLAFPNTLGINASGPSATDGTEFVKAFIDDIWGARYALMDFAGLTPDGVTEAPGTSQFLEALLLIGPGPGIGVEWLLNDDPGVTGHRALFRYGQGVLVASYLLLDSNCYVGDANNAAVHAAGGGFYRASDAAGTLPNIAGPYLILPETRGYSPRGLDLAASVDPGGASRYLGDHQLDAMQRITGNSGEVAISLVAGNPNGVYSGSTTIGISNAPNLGALAKIQILAYDNANSTSPNAAKTNDVETRGSNFSTKYVVFY